MIMSTPLTSAPYRTQPSVAVTAAIALLSLLLGSACGGKGVAGDCPDIAACGGNPVGVWKVESACEFNEPGAPKLAVPIPSALSVPQSPTLATTPPPNTTTSGDWCSGLVYKAPIDATDSTVGNVSFFTLPLSVTNAYNINTIAFLDDGNGSKTYSTSVFGASPEVTHFTRTCLNAYGANPTCSELQAGLRALTSVNYVNDSLLCSASADNGCDCAYTEVETSGDVGVWRVEGTSIIQFPGDGKPRQTTDFCVNGNTMTIGGKNGSHLLNSAGRRSMVLTKCSTPSCTDAP